MFFSLGDLGKSLPEFEEIALPVEMDADTYAQYDRTRQQLKDYLIARRWEGDVSFRGSYLQWAMGWPNALFRPEQVIHNLRHPLTGEVQPQVVASLPSFGEERIFAKEQALLDLVTRELAANRPCVIYLRQTSTRDIQPRIEQLIRQHVPGAKPFILKNTVDAERREAVIEAEVAKGCNLLICNPELTKTGLDLLHFPTIIFHELVFNLSTLMQAAARSFRLNQTHPLCKVYYLYYEDTMEASAVQLMSRKQRAAKLLTGEIGLTGLDALTEGEGSFEAALLDAIGRDETLLDPATLFKTTTAAQDILLEDAAYWNTVTASADDPLSADPVIALGRELGGSITLSDLPQPVLPTAEPRSVPGTLEAYLDSVQLIPDDQRRAELQAHLIAVLRNRLQGNASTVVGIQQPDFSTDASHEARLTEWVTNWLKQERFVFTGCETEVAHELIRQAKTTFGLPPVMVSPAPVKPIRQPKLARKRQPDLLAVPSDIPTEPAPKRVRPLERREGIPEQLSLF